MSSNDIAIKVSGLSKMFEVYKSPKDFAKQVFFGRWKTFYKPFWALQNINFEIKKGECVGVIGKNGAGKSTLLQLLVGTLDATSGTIEKRGRVAALLELGSGFNPMFTGRENVYLNAAILGLSKEETDEKFAAIEEFADIGDFIDRPVMTYSSGMMVRLAFAVQIMVEPDILIVDEALAVGDAAFQRKCYARLEQLIKKGMTLFLVTHDTETVKRLCSRAIYLRKGNIVFNGDAIEGVALYMQELFGNDTKKSKDMTTAETSSVSEVFSRGQGGAWFSELRVDGLLPGNIMPAGKKMTINLKLEWDQDVIREMMLSEDVPGNIFVGYAIANSQNTRLFGTNTVLAKCPIDPFASTSATVKFTIDVPALAAGEYFLVSAIHLGNMANSIELVWNDFAQPIVSNVSNAGGLLQVATTTNIQKV